MKSEVIYKFDIYVFITVFEYSILRLLFLLLNEPVSVLLYVAKSHKAVTSASEFCQSPFLMFLMFAKFTRCVMCLAAIFTYMSVSVKVKVNTAVL